MRQLCWHNKFFFKGGRENKGLKLKILSRNSGFSTIRFCTSTGAIVTIESCSRLNYKYRDWICP